MGAEVAWQALSLLCCGQSASAWCSTQVLLLGATPRPAAVLREHSIFLPVDHNRTHRDFVAAYLDASWWLFLPLDGVHLRFDLLALSLCQIPHRGLNGLVAHQLLNGLQVDAGLQQLRAVGGAKFVWMKVPDGIAEKRVLTGTKNLSSNTLRRPVLAGFVCYTLNIKPLI